MPLPPPPLDAPARPRSSSSPSSRSCLRDPRDRLAGRPRRPGRLAGPRRRAVRGPRPLVRRGRRPRRPRPTCRRGSRRDLRVHHAAVGGRARLDARPDRLPVACTSAAWAPRPTSARRHDPSPEPSQWHPARSRRARSAANEHADRRGVCPRNRPPGDGFRGIPPPTRRRDRSTACEFHRCAIESVRAMPTARSVVARPNSRRDERGQASVELLGLLPLIVFLALVGVHGRRVRTPPTSRRARPPRPARSRSSRAATDPRTAAREALPARPSAPAPRSRSPAAACTCASCPAPPSDPGPPQPPRRRGPRRRRPGHAMNRALDFFLARRHPSRSRRRHEPGASTAPTRRRPPRRHRPRRRSRSLRPPWRRIRARSHQATRSRWPFASPSPLRWPPRSRRSAPSPPAGPPPRRSAPVSPVAAPVSPTAPARSPPRSRRPRRSRSPPRCVAGRARRAPCSVPPPISAAAFAATHRRRGRRASTRGRAGRGGVGARAAPRDAVEGRDRRGDRAAAAGGERWEGARAASRRPARGARARGACAGPARVGAARSGRARSRGRWRGRSRCSRRRSCSRSRRRGRPRSTRRSPIRTSSCSLRGDPDGPLATAAAAGLERVVAVRPLGRGLGAGALARGRSARRGRFVGWSSQATGGDGDRGGACECATCSTRAS